MKVPKLRVRSILTFGLVMLSVLYGLLVLNVTIVSVQNNELEPSFSSGQVIFLTKDASIHPGDVVAVEQANGIRLRRVFAMGPITVNCTKQSGYVGNELVPFSSEDSRWLNAGATGYVSERWGQISVRIQRKMKLVSTTLSAKSLPTEVPAGSFLIGCQNRIQCSGCGFESAQREQVIGKMRESDWLHRWLAKASGVWR